MEFPKEKTMKTVLAKSILALASAAGVMSLPTTAKADHLDRFHIEIRNDHRRDEVRRVWVEPVYEERATRVWVEPVYRTECVPVYVEGGYETRCEKVWVEPVFEVRDVVRYEHGHRRFCRERVCIREGHWENVERRVRVSGHYENQDRQVLATPGHFEDRCERVCVREGYWRTVEFERPHDRFSIGFGFGGRF
jgi:hypothetical protein